MTIKQELFTSFVNGIGKTLGTVVVFGVCGTIFYFYSNNIQKNTKNTKNINKEEDINIVEEKSKQEIENDTSDLQDENGDVEMEELSLESRYKVIFDKLIN